MTTTTNNTIVSTIANLFTSNEAKIEASPKLMKVGSIVAQCFTEIGYTLTSVDDRAVLSVIVKFGNECKTAHHAAKLALVAAKRMGMHSNNMEQFAALEAVVSSWQGVIMNQRGVRRTDNKFAAIGVK